MKGNACVDSLAASARRPDEGQIGKDLGFVADSNPLVKTLVRWRHNAIAHRNARHAIDPQEFAKRSPVSFADMQTLIDEGIGILNRYGSLFHANTHASSMVGHDDYRSVLKSVRAHLKAWKAQCEEEYQRAFLMQTKTADGAFAAAKYAPMRTRVATRQSVTFSPKATAVKTGAGPARRHGRDAPTTPRQLEISWAFQRPQETINERQRVGLASEVARNIAGSGVCGFSSNFLKQPFFPPVRQFARRCQVDGCT